MKGLKLEPGWRQAWVTWLNLFFSKSKPPISARMAPVCVDMATKAPSTSGSWVISQAPLEFLMARITAPGRILILGGALGLRPDSAGLRLSPVISKWVPSARAATILRGDASSTTAATTSPLSGWLARASSMASSSS
ncbi:hypothetical protein SDC9_197342 [bioreactor metagenome]|uniref:Uncharacterized protein n=1 Tax=bioreactor metagenome TaxID=1076179 RepID=A0A645IF35_9ZZZZ